MIRRNLLALNWFSVRPQSQSWDEGGSRFIFIKSRCSIFFTTDKINDMEQEYRRTTNTVSLINYHFVFCPRYRRKVLIKDVDRRFREILQEICDEYSLMIVDLEVMPDHVHLFVYALPSISPLDIMAKVKGVT